jgi:hypothetical protein
MISGGTVTIIVLILNIELPFGLDATFYGIILSAIVLVTLSKIWQDHA